MDRVWYVAYGTNLSLARFRCYLLGGRPDGGARTHPGSIERAEPRAVATVDIPGALHFGGRSGLWGGGGMATYDGRRAGRVAARAYLLSVRQLGDVLAQETRREPGGAIDLTALDPDGCHRLGPGRYRTIVRVGTRAGVPMVSFTGDVDREDDLAPPTAPYLRVMARGLRESRDWPPELIASYLSAIPGAAPHWSPAAIAALAA